MAYPVYEKQGSATGIVILIWLILVCPKHQAEAGIGEALITVPN